jgi:hypothetical protein
MTTSKLLPTSIGFTLNGMDMVALVTRLASVSRINKHKLYAMFYRLVSQKLPQLKERPAITESSFFFGAKKLISSFSDSCQIFQANELICNFSFTDYAMANGVVYPFLKALLLTRQPFQQCPTSAPRTARAFRGFLLDLCSQIGVMISDFGNFFTAKFISLGGNNNVSSAQVTAQNLICFSGFWWDRFELNIQVIQRFSLL